MEIQGIKELKMSEKDTIIFLEELFKNNDAVLCNYTFTKVDANGNEIDRLVIPKGSSIPEYMVECILEKLSCYKQEHGLEETRNVLDASPSLCSAIRKAGKVYGATLNDILERNAA